MRQRTDSSQSGTARANHERQHLLFRIRAGGAPAVLCGNRPGQEIEYPMAIVILGGLATSTLLNLFALLALYLSIGAYGSPDPAASKSPSMSR
jgi:hypothetical protein